jgi:Phytanoyl-CoA dioxygenase (PhyH)
MQGDLPQVDVDSFRSEGYLILKGLFSREEMIDLRERVNCIKLRDLQDKNFLMIDEVPGARFLMGDVLSKYELKDIDYLILDDRIIHVAKQLLGPEIVYFGDSSVQTGEGFRGFHKDNVNSDRYDSTMPDWRSDYTLIKFGIYVQDHSKHSGGLKVRRMSHRFPSYKQGTAVDLQTELGDVVVWNLRTTHSGNVVKIKGFPWLVLHPRLETKVPTWLRLPEDHERVLITSTFGCPDSHLDRYIEHMINRGDYHPYFLRSAYNEEVLQLIRSKGVQFRKPIPEYGSLHSQLSTNYVA